MKDKQYKLVIRERMGMYWAFYVLVDADPVYIIGNNQVADRSLRGVLKKARKIKPDDGDIAFTYLDRNSN